MRRLISGRGVRLVLLLSLLLLNQCQRDGGGKKHSSSSRLDDLGPNVFVITAAVVDGDMHGTFASVFVQVADPAAFGSNRAPAIHSVHANPATVAPFGTVQLSADVTDEDGDPLRVAWIVPAGLLGGSATVNETWRAPSQPGTYILQAMASDGKVWSGGTVSVQVTGPAGTGGTGNHPPLIRSLVASAVRVAPGQTVSLTMDASDAEGDSLSYGWGAPTGGTLGGSSGPSESWTAPAAPGSRPAHAARWIWPRVAPPDCPFPWSTEILGMAFTGRAATQHFCDTWMPAWASDGAMYSPWQDGVLLTPPYRNYGGWFGASEPAQNGWARIVGDDPQDLLIPDAGQAMASKGFWMGRYPAAMFVRDGVLYYGSRFTAVFDPNGNLTSDPNQMYRWANGPFAGFRTSTDGGHSWTESPCTDTHPLFPETATGSTRVKFGQPYLVDFGKNQERSPDGKVYFVSTGSVDGSAAADHLNDDQVYLCRVTPTPANVNDASKYEFYAGNGQWSSTFASSKPIVEWRNHFSGATATWNPGLGKFILIAYKNGYTVNGSKVDWGDFDTFVLESSALAGPWKLVAYLPAFGKQGYYPNLPSKFLSADGRSAWLWYGANFSPWDRPSDPPGSGYHLCEQEVRFITSHD